MVEKLLDDMFRWKTPQGVCRIQRVPGGTIVLSGTSGSQTFSNPQKLSLEDYCKQAYKRGTSYMREVAREHKEKRINKNVIQESFKAMKQEGVLDNYSFQRLMHMTRSCNCTPERMYYRLKLFFGTEKEKLADRVSIKAETPLLDNTVNEFFNLCSQLSKQSFKPAELSER